MMKSIKIFGICLVFAAGVASLTSCENWFDVRPKTQVAAPDMFASEDGFIDVLTGVYIQMTNTAMYGREMTYGMVDCIGKVYTSAGTDRYNDLLGHKYDTQLSKPIVDGVWQKTYAAIANLNIMIDALETADKKMFEEANYHCIYGEALALRAFLHFDMLRLYAPAFSVDPNAVAIPYVTEFGYDVTPSSTVKEVADLILGDLEDAAGMLKDWDPVLGNQVTDWMPSIGSRVFHMNYYAVKATQARAYHWIGKTTEAAQCAREVIASPRYTWTGTDQMATTEAARERTFATEQIFALQVSKMEDNIRNILNQADATGTSWPNRLLQSEAWRNTVIPGSDWRKTYFYTNAYSGTTTGERFNNKLYQFEEMPENSRQRMPLIRLPEMHLIVAQCDPAAAVGALNEIHSHRGLGANIPSTISSAELVAEINMEYLREFVCEGVAFYNWKRQNSPQMTNNNGALADIDPDVYVLPIPDEEKQFGGREDGEEE